MVNFLGKNLINVSTPRVTTGVSGRGLQPVNQSFKTAGYASIPYERAPKVEDTVPTTDAKGNALLAGYVTPKHVWTC
jgi:hypothetical protein